MCRVASKVILDPEGEVEGVAKGEESRSHDMKMADLHCPQALTKPDEMFPLQVCKLTAQEIT